MKNKLLVIFISITMVFTMSISVFASGEIELEGTFLEDYEVLREAEEKAEILEDVVSISRAGVICYEKVLLSIIFNSYFCNRCFIAGTVC